MLDYGLHIYKGELLAIVRLQLTKTEEKAFARNPTDLVRRGLN